MTEELDVVTAVDEESSVGAVPSGAEKVLMSVIVAVALAGMIFFFITGSPCHFQKHTGPIQIIGGNYYNGFVAKRPNHEVFIIKFDDSTLGFNCGTKLKDLTYTDVSSDTRHFVKATLDETPSN